MVDKTPLIDYVIAHQSALINTDFLRELYMIPDRMEGEYESESGTTIYFTIHTESPLYLAKLFVYDRMFYGITDFRRSDDRSSDVKSYKVSAQRTGINYDPASREPLCTPQEVMPLKQHDIANYQGPDVETTLGRFIANYLFLVYPFGDIIPYINAEITSSMLEKAISAPLLDGRITTQQVKDKYINTLSLIGQSNEMICPNISEKTITVPKHIAELRRKLVSDNKAALEAGDASVMSDIEKQLIAEYKEYLKGDPSMHFLLKKKYFDVTLKKLFLVQGMTEVFGSPGKFVFVDNPMGDGWQIKDLPAIYNEVRSGSYARAVETAQGGVIAKLILRVLQDTRIAIDDCGTVRGEQVVGTAQNLKDFEWNYVVEGNPDKGEIPADTNVIVGGTSLITAETMSSYVGRNLTIRTPGYCEATQGFCAKCFGRLFEILGQKAFAPVANDFARNQTTNSLKSMHGKSHSVVDVSDINLYLVGA